VGDDEGFDAAGLADAGGQVDQVAQVEPNVRGVRRQDTWVQV
jgi:hypothetical protein